MEQIVLEGSRLAEWPVTAYVDQAGQVFLPGGAFGDEKPARLCLSHDGVAFVRDGEHTDAPATWPRNRTRAWPRGSRPSPAMSRDAWPRATPRSPLSAYAGPCRVPCPPATSQPSAGFGAGRGERGGRDGQGARPAKAKAVATGGSVPAQQARGDDPRTRDGGRSAHPDLDGPARCAGTP